MTKRNCFYVLLSLAFISPTFYMGTRAAAVEQEKIPTKEQKLIAIKNKLKKLLAYTKDVSIEEAIINFALDQFGVDDLELGDVLEELSGDSEVSEYIKDGNKKLG